MTGSENRQVAPDSGKLDFRGGWRRLDCLWNLVGDVDCLTRKRLVHYWFAKEGSRTWLIAKTETRNKAP